MSRTPAEIVAAVQMNLMDATASTEVAARVVEFLKRAQNQLEDARFSPAQHAVAAATNTTASSALVALPADWIGIRIDRDLDPIVAPHWIDGDGAAHLLLEPFFVDDVTSLRRGYGYALVAGQDPPVGAPQVVLHDAANELGAGADWLHVLPLSDGRNTAGLYQALTNYPVRIPYWKRLAAFDGTTANWFTTHCDEYLEFAATGLGLIANRDPNAATYVTAARAEIERLRMRVREGRSAKVATIRGRGYALGTPSLRSRRARDGGL